MTPKKKAFNYIKKKITTDENQNGTIIRALDRS